MAHDTNERTRLPIGILGLVLGMFLGMLDGTIVGTALPTIVGELGGTCSSSRVRPRRPAAC